MECAFCHPPDPRFSAKPRALSDVKNRHLDLIANLYRGAASSGLTREPAAPEPTPASEEKTGKKTTTTSANMDIELRVDQDLMTQISDAEEITVVRSSFVNMKLAAPVSSERRRLRLQGARLTNIEKSRHLDLSASSLSVELQQKQKTCLASAVLKSTKNVDMTIARACGCAIQKRLAQQNPDALLDEAKASMVREGEDVLVQVFATNSTEPASGLSYLIGECLHHGLVPGEQASIKRRHVQEDVGNWIRQVSHSSSSSSASDDRLVAFQKVVLPRVLGAKVVSGKHPPELYWRLNYNNLVSFVKEKLPLLVQKTEHPSVFPDDQLCLSFDKAILNVVGPILQEQDQKNDNLVLRCNVLLTLTEEAPLEVGVSVDVPPGSQEAVVTVTAGLGQAKQEKEDQKAKKPQPKKKKPPPKKQPAKKAPSKKTANKPAAAAKSTLLDALGVKKQQDTSSEDDDDDDSD
jgi:hypothetical protein